MDTQKFIQQVASGEASAAKDTLADLLSNRAFEALDYKKQEIATTLYSNGEDIADTEIEEDELLTQEEFDALSEEDQELYLEAIEQLKEGSDGYEVKQSKTDSDVHHVHYKGKKIGSVYGNKKGMWGHEYHPMGTGDHGYSSKKEAVDAVKDDHLQHLSMKEEVEQLDEIGDTPAGKKALGSYVKKRVKQLPAIEVNYQMAPDEGGPFGAKRIKKFKTKVNKGIGRAVDRLAK